MKRTLSVLLILTIAMLSVFALQPQNSNFNIYGYYHGSTLAEGSMRVVLTAYTGNVINLGSVELGPGHIGAEKQVFSWELESTMTSGTARITFEFSTLEAFTNGKYHHPSYTLKLVNESTLSASSNTISVTRQDNYLAPSTAKNSFSLSGSAVVNSEQTGYVTLNVTDMISDSGTYNYRSIVTVKLEAL